jgi:hypothetical protein
VAKLKDIKMVGALVEEAIVEDIIAPNGLLQAEYIGEQFLKGEFEPTGTALGYNRWEVVEAPDVDIDGWTIRYYTA